MLNVDGDSGNKEKWCAAAALLVEGLASGNGDDFVDMAATVAVELIEPDEGDNDGMVDIDEPGDAEFELALR